MLGIGTLLSGRYLLVCTWTLRVPSFSWTIKGQRGVNSKGNNGTRNQDASACGSGFGCGDAPGVQVHQLYRRAQHRRDLPNPEELFGAPGRMGIAVGIHSVLRAPELPTGLVDWRAASQTLRRIPQVEPPPNSGL